MHFQIMSANAMMRMQVQNYQKNMDFQRFMDFMKRKNMKVVRWYALDPMRVQNTQEALGHKPQSLLPVKHCFPDLLKGDGNVRSQPSKASRRCQDWQEERKNAVE